MRRKKGFSEWKFVSLFMSGLYVNLVLYVMLLSKSIIAGQLIGEEGIAAVNAVVPVTGIVAFLGGIVSTGVAIIHTREIGAMRKQRADEIFGQGLIVSVSVGLLSALVFFLLRRVYFRASSISGEILEYAWAYYRFVPLNAFLTIVLCFLEAMVYSDGDKLCNDVCYLLQFGGNVLFSVILTNAMGMTGLMLGSVIGNVLGLAACCWHFFRKSCTLRFVWHFSLRDFRQAARYGILDSLTYLNWSLMLYVMTAFIASRYGDTELTVLAVVISLIEFGVVLDGVGMAVKPLVGTYYGEKNHRLIKRVMRSGIKAAFLEGAAATALIWLFARQFCGIFGITDGAALAPAISAVKIVALGFCFCSAVSLMSSYYMLIDRIGLAVGISCLHNGVFYILLPIVGSFLRGARGIWAGYALAPAAALAAALLFVALRFGKENFPFLLQGMNADIAVLDDILTPRSAAELSGQIEESLLSHRCPAETARRVALFAEEIGLTILERNRKLPLPVFIEFSLFREKDSVLVIQRDTGELFDPTDPELQPSGLSSFVLSALMRTQEEKAYQVTTNYNRNIIRFPFSRQEKG